MKTLLFSPPKYNGQFITVNDCCWGTGELQVLQDRLLRTGSYLLTQGDEVGFMDAGMLDYNWADVFRELKEVKPDRLIFQVVPQFESFQTIVANICSKLGIKPIAMGITDWHEHFMGEYGCFSTFSLHAPTWDKMPPINFGLIKSYSHYVLSPVLQISEGCPYNCKMCVWSRKDFKMLPVDTLFESLKDYREDVPVYLLTAQITTNKTWLEKFVERKKEFNLDFKYTTDIHPKEVSEDKIELLIESGCTKATMGVESTNQDVLDAINKGISNSDQEYAVSLCNHFGLELTIPFMYNVLPNEDVEKDIAFYKHFGGFNPSPGIIKAYPGTDFYSNLSENHDWTMEVGTNPIPTNPYMESAIKCLKKWESVLNG